MLTREENLKAKTKRKSKATTNSKHDKPIAPNLLKREFTISNPDIVYLDDITYVLTHSVVASMSRKGDCWDSVVAEIYFHTLKTELVQHCDFQTHEDARAEIFEYIEVFYNRQRFHSTNNYEALFVFWPM